MRGKFSKKKKKNLLINHKGDEAETWHIFCEHKVLHEL